jgi:ATP-binding cassette subfamily B protein
MVLSSLSELISLGAVMPFLATILDPDIILKREIIVKMANLFSLYSKDDIFLFITINFIAAVVAASALRTFLQSETIRVSFQIGAHITNKIYYKIINQKYSDHIAINSSEKINSITNKANEVIFYILLPSISFLSSLIMVLIVMVYLINFLPLNVLIAMSILAVIYIAIAKFSGAVLKRNSLLAASLSTYSIKILQESLGGIRDVLINNLQQYFCEIFEENDRLLRKAQSSSQFISQFPKYVIEGLGMLLVIIIAYLSTLSQDATSVVPMLAILALGAQRLLPGLQQIYYSRTTILGNQSSLADVINLLDIRDDVVFNSINDKIMLEKNFVLKTVDLSFKYNQEYQFILENVNIEINRGDRVAVVGETGSGKSTLIDILMGLLEPTSGYLMLNEQVISKNNMQSWQSHVSHVPQSVFLSDTSIAENIAFGVVKELIDFNRVMECAKLACISSFIEHMPNKYNTLIGERGAFLSGGQRQRLGIARALYKKASVIVLDEATSALDEGTETEVMKALYNMPNEITLIIIAHRLTTISLCNKKFKISNKNIIEVTH